MRPLDPRLLRFARAARGYVGLSVGLGILSAALVVAGAGLLAWMISAVFLGGATLVDIRPALGWLAAVTVARAGVAWTQEVAAHRSAHAVKAQLRQALFGQVAQRGPGWLTGERSGELATLATRGVDALDAYLARYLPQLVLAVVAPVVVLATVIPADLIAGATIALTLPLIPLFMVLVGLGVQQRTERQFQLLARLSHHFLDVVAGLPTLKIFGRAKAQARAIADVTAAHRRVSLATLRLAFLSSLVLEFVATISVALVAVGIGLRLVSGSLDLRTALLVLILAPEAYLPLRQLGAQYHASAEGVAAAARVFAVLELPTAGPVGMVAPPDPRRAALVCKGVTVRFDGRAEPALADFDLTVGPGELVALTGPSGAGKSTVFNAVLGFVRPVAGSVALVAGDGADAVTVDEADPRAWLSQIGWVAQRPYLVAGTIDENVRLGREAETDTATAGAVRAALELAAASAFVDALPDGVRTVVGAGGRRLSAGQRQRIALARMFLRDAPMVLLDEPTASLDPATEAAVIAALRQFAEGRMVIVIAHRPALLAVADRIVHLDAPVSHPGSRAVDSPEPVGRGELVA